MFFCKECPVLRDAAPAPDQTACLPAWSATEQPSGQAIEASYRAKSSWGFRFTPMRENPSRESLKGIQAD